MTKLRLRTRVNFPANVTGEGGIDIRKENGQWVIFPDFSDLNEITAGETTDPTTQQIWIYDPVNDSYAVLTLARLGDALYVAASTTSLAIGTGSNAFTIQTGKDFGVGSYVIATSDANPDTDYMFGQITDYTGATLTVNVTVTGGSGTHADWTIRLAGARGITGATGASPGIKQAYSTTTADADPGNGTFRLNNATPASATAAYLDNLDASGATVSTVFDLWDDSTNTIKGELSFEKSGDSTAWAKFQVTGSVVDGTGYRKLTLQNGAGSGAFTNGDTFAITFIRAGDKGADGAGNIGGSTGASDNRLLRSDGVGGVTLQNSVITVDDSGNMSGVGTLETTGNITENGNRVAAIADPNADRVLIWDDSAVAYVGAALQGQIEISGTTLRATEIHGIAASDETTSLTTGTNKATFSLPYAFTVTSAYATLNTVSSSGAVIVDINEAGTTILSTKLTIDQSEKTSGTAATPPVISDSSIAANAEIGIDIDGAGTGAKGLKVFIQGYKT